MHLEVKPETIRFLTISLDLRKKIWVVEYEIEGRGTGIVAVRIDETTGEEEICEPRFTRMLIRVVIDARTGKKIRMEGGFSNDCQGSHGILALRLFFPHIARLFIPLFMRTEEGRCYLEMILAS